MTTEQLKTELVPDETETVSSTQSLSKYNLPNDELEAERLDLQHHLFLLTFDDSLGLAPPNKAKSEVKRVLDLGTGTGIWAMDFGDEHPEAHVVGVDLSPIQPTFVPPNVEFFIDDTDEEWNHSAPFDYIHSRMMTSSIRNWPDYLKKIYDNLNPGGYVELQEADLFLSSDDTTLHPTQSLPQCLKLMVYGWDRERVLLFLVDVRRELNDTGIHAYWPVYSIYARKPKV
ncbi:hypothetical protein CDV31_012222 [Fusarium ambrosium]|uniref:Methyltransferase domain-containing protein n=1 Tax=Fusarium ambrosium TaxID=131363 RepID=A0A428TBF0_9HYPO|nr:hypothetical protein CDV31_012222 [Fusarium ambrosium]